MDRNSTQFGSEVKFHPVPIRYKMQPILSGDYNLEQNSLDQYLHGQKSLARTMMTNVYQDASRN